MATEIQKNWINRLSQNLKQTIAETAEQQDRDEQIAKALRREMSKKLRDQRMNGAIYAFMKVV